MIHYSPATAILSLVERSLKILLHTFLRALKFLDNLNHLSVMVGTS